MLTSFRVMGSLFPAAPTLTGCMLSYLSQTTQGLDDPLDLPGAFGVLAAEVCGELFGGGGGVGEEELADEGDLVREAFR